MDDYTSTNKGAGEILTVMLHVALKRVGMTTRAIA